MTVNESIIMKLTLAPQLLKRTNVLNFMKIQITRLVADTISQTDGQTDTKVWLLHTALLYLCKEFATKNSFLHFSLILHIILV
jgi:hypothetical protein